MKKVIFLSLFTLLLVVGLMAQTPARTAQQQLELQEGEILDIVTNTGLTHSDQYILRITHVESNEVRGTDLGAPIAAIRIAKVGNASVGYNARALFNQSQWPAAWPEGSHLKIEVWYTGAATVPGGVDPYPALEYATVTQVVPAGTGVISYLDPAMILPPWPVAQDFTLAITSNYPGAAIWKDGMDTGFQTPHTFDPAEAGTYTLSLPEVEWQPTEYVYDGMDNAMIHFQGTKTPMAAMNPMPENGAVITREWDAMDEAVALSWDPVAGVDGYNLYWNGDPQPVWLTDPMWTTPAIGAGAYTWKVEPYIQDPAKGALRSSLAPKGPAIDPPTWSFTIELEEAPDVPNGVPTVIGDVTVTTNADLDIIPVAPDNPVIVALPNLSNLNDSEIIGLTGTGVVDLVFSVGPGTWYGMIYVGGSWIMGVPYPLVGPGDILFAGVDFDAKGDVIILLGEGADPTLPVELSSFTATLTATLYVQLNWITESETNMLGYRVYRSETAELNDATMITPVMIGATNTSTTQHYSWLDNEVSVGTTYNYWLEAVDMGHSTFHGPQTVVVTGEVTPELPTATILGNAYPNPFRGSTNIELSVKEGENATVTIYNILGQVVKTYNKGQGVHNINWDGRDSRGNACGSGIYFYKLSSPSMNQTKKMVIVK